MDARPLDLDTYLVFARLAASTGFWFDLKLKCSCEEKMEGEPGSKAINKKPSQESFQWSGLLHSLPRQGAAQHHTWQEKIHWNSFRHCSHYRSSSLQYMEDPPSNWKRLYLSVKLVQLVLHAYFSCEVVAVECNTTLIRDHPRGSHSSIPVSSDQQTRVYHKGVTKWIQVFKNEREAGMLEQRPGLEEVSEREGDSFPFFYVLVEVLVVSCCWCYLRLSCSWSFSWAERLPAAVLVSRVNITVLSCHVLTALLICPSLSDRSSFIWQTSSSSFFYWALQLIFL